MPDPDPPPPPVRTAEKLHPVAGTLKRAPSSVPRDCMRPVPCGSARGVAAPEGDGESEGEKLRDGDGEGDVDELGVAEDDKEELADALKRFAVTSGRLTLVSAPAGYVMPTMDAHAGVKAPYQLPVSAANSASAAAVSVFTGQPLGLLVLAE